MKVPYVKIVGLNVLHTSDMPLASNNIVRLNVPHTFYMPLASNNTYREVKTIEHVLQFLVLYLT
jgi:hypothetical protein